MRQEREYAFPETRDVVNFLGALASTPGIEEDITKQCNAYIKALIVSLNPMVEEVARANAGKIITFS